MDAPCAIGSLAPGGAWVGFRRTDEVGYELVLGQDGSLRVISAEPELLLAAAITYFEEALPDAPPDLEATQADLAALVRHLASRETDPGRLRLLAEAVDAIDDGLAGDAVASRLLAVWQSSPTARVRPELEPVDALLARAQGAAG
jgi:hypothetical protein